MAYIYEGPTKNPKIYTGYFLDGPMKGQMISMTNHQYCISDYDKPLYGENLDPSELVSLKELRYDFVEFVDPWARRWGIWMPDPSPQHLVNSVTAWAKFCWWEWWPCRINAYAQHVQKHLELQKKHIPVKEYQHRWWFDPEFNKDRYCLYVTRSCTVDGMPYSYEYLNRAGNWIRSDYQVEIEPALDLSGMLVYALTAAGALKVERHEVAKALTELIDSIVQNTVTEVLQDGTS